jgi:4-hydroxy-3-methylbut-2-enyl diphosphate reductase
MIAAYGPEEASTNYAAFDTICDATQVRQDAIQEMAIDAKSTPLDMILVVGGWDSSNTGHLLEIPVHEGITAYHINAADCIKSDNSVIHRTVDGKIEVSARAVRGAQGPCELASAPAPAAWRFKCAFVGV